MHTSLQTVAISDITIDDRTFVVTEGRNTEALQRSIAACGMLQPPYLWRSGPETAWIPVCGYLRLLAARNLRIEELSVGIFDPETPHSDLLACALLDNLGHRQFNPVETAHGLQRLLDCLPRSRVIEQWLPRFGLTASARTLERCMRLCALEPPVRAALIAGNLTEASALRLSTYSTDDQRAVFSLMQQLHLSTGKQTELLECLEDLARRDAAPLREVAAADDIAHLCADEQLNRVQKTEQVRRCLRARRFPRLQAAEDHFTAALKDVRPGAGIRIMAPPNFEGRMFRLEISFSSAAELRRRVSDLLSADQQPALERLFAENGDAMPGPHTPEPQNA
jgi:ParB-like chromosome segregation protein Spo0J